MSRIKHQANAFGTLGALSVVAGPGTGNKLRSIRCQSRIPSHQHIG